MKKRRIILTGATGMIGESVLDRCLANEQITKVLAINRRPMGIAHPKLSEIVHADLSDLSAIKPALEGFDACFFCIGVSSVGMDEATYTALTHTLTLNFASALAQINPDMTFCYISGAGTDSSEKGNRMWARVKGKTENDLMTLPFKSVYNFRPGALIPYLPIKPTQTYQSVKYLKWLMVLLRPLMPNQIIRMEDFADAMIQSALTGYHRPVLETTDIRKLATRR